MKSALLFTCLFGAFTLNAQTGIQKQMLDTFVKYASIDSQSQYSDSDFPMTEGQHNMALALKADVENAVKISNAKDVGVTLSSDNYLYVDIPSNVKRAIPTLGISCHLDVTPEAQGGNISPIVDERDGHTIVRTDGSTLLGADDKCGCTIAIQLIRTILTDKKMKHGRIQFVFCPNEDIGLAAERIDTSLFFPDILFDLDGEGGEAVTQSNFSARGVKLKFIGKDAHPAVAKREKYGDATAAAATFIAFFPVDIRPENTEGLQGYIHPWNFVKTGSDVVVDTRIRYFDKLDGSRFDALLKDAITKVKTYFPNVGIEVLFDGVQYENVAYSMHPASRTIIEKAASKIGKTIRFVDERGGTTASMFAAKGLRGGMGIFTGQHHVHSTSEYADFQEMEETYLLMVNVIDEIANLK